MQFSNTNSHDILAEMGPCRNPWLPLPDPVHVYVMEQTALSFAISGTGNKHENSCRQLELSCTFQIHPEKCWVFQGLIRQVCDSPRLSLPSKLKLGENGWQPCFHRDQRVFGPINRSSGSSSKADTQQYVQKHLFSEWQTPLNDRYPNTTLLLLFNCSYNYI